MQQPTWIFAKQDPVAMREAGSIAGELFKGEDPGKGGAMRGLLSWFERCYRIL